MRLWEEEKRSCFFFLWGNLTSQKMVIIPLAQVANELGRMKAAKQERGLSARAEPEPGSGWERGCVFCLWCTELSPDSSRVSRAGLPGSKCQARGVWAASHCQETHRWTRLALPLCPPSPSLPSPTSLDVSLIRVSQDLKEDWGGGLGLVRQQVTQSQMEE